LRTTFVATTGVLYSLAKVSEFVLKLPQTIGASLLLVYGVWLAWNVVIESIHSNVYGRH